ncbi:MAG TPA: hypothetical protein DD379_19335 [Cyanobacteria bacterium UBA11162]|nr:hypothetical protein [Cyanobacteria bacterium UBA12227]HAX88247.1 hypothetical protein [Cyanobacteria bacterium UBA11370]HBL13507.1 hypothetical protein [Cyanobacteria bacterium UBA11162]HBY77985.1 hypothetical protein [Cyanobacteria bacterium UBA11148]
MKQLSTAHSAASLIDKLSVKRKLSKEKKIETTPLQGLMWGLFRLSRASTGRESSPNPLRYPCQFYQNGWITIINDKQAQKIWL